ncbi:hypothetical protein V2W45_1339157 [Cenococcum geophilum]
MSNTSYVPPSDDEPTRNEQDSVEGFHNDIHVMNIDCIIAIWQALNPKKRFKRQPLRGGPTYVTATMTEERSTSPLVPFRKGFGDNGTPLWWTSNEVRDCRTLGYTYCTPRFLQRNQTLARYESGSMITMNLRMGFKICGLDLSLYEGTTSE